MAVVTWLAVKYVIDPRVDLASTLGRVIEVGGGIAVGGLTFLLAALALRMEEIPLILRLYRARGGQA
jgi:hypothetical protein